MSNLALCIACGVEEPAPILCTTCSDKARRNLDTIGRLRRELDPMPCRGRGSRPSGKPGSRPPANLTVLAITDSRSHIRIDWDTGEPDVDNVSNVDHDLLTEARLLIEERQLSHPIRDAFDCLRVIHIHWDYLVRSPRADEFVAVLDSCARGLRQAVRGGREPAVGRCTAPHDTRTACNGPLRLVWPNPVHSDPDEVYAPLGAVCGVCGASVDVPMLLELLAVFGPAEFPVSREWVAATLGLNPNTLRTWVRRRKVHGYDDGTVNLVDVLAKLATH